MPSSHDLGAMFLLGLLGAGHCVVMCGPIAVAIGAGAPARERWIAGTLYNVGRLTIYSLVGALAGGIAGRIDAFAPMLRVQLWITMGTSVLLAWLGLALLGVVREPRWLDLPRGLRIPGADWLLARLASRGSASLALPLGMLLGLLPCGLSYAAFLRALSAPNALHGGLLVASFGAGTVPAMVGAAWVGHRLGGRLRGFAQAAAGMVLVGIAAQQLGRVTSALIG